MIIPGNCHGFDCYAKVTLIVIDKIMPHPYGYRIRAKYLKQEI